MKLGDSVDEVGPFVEVGGGDRSLRGGIGADGLRDAFPRSVHRSGGWRGEFR